jgi:hypothetical protein
MVNNDKKTEPQPPLPVETPRGHKAIKAAIAERHKAEGMSEYSNVNPRWDGRVFNPNKLWSSRLKRYL